MFRKIDTKTLIIIFIVLFSVVLVVQWWDRHKGERTFKSELLTLDSAKVTAIYVYPKNAKTGAITLSKISNGWTVTNQAKTFSGDVEFISSMLKDLSHLKSMRVAATDKSKWKEFELTDSAATRVKIEVDKKIEGDLYVGKFSYQQSQNPYQQRGGSVSTYVRVAGDDNVYVVDGFLSMMFNREVSSYRNRNLISSTKDNWTKLTFTYPDSSFTLSKDKNKWTLNGQATDSTKVVNYFNAINNLSSSEFVDNVLAGSPLYTLKIEGNGLAIPIEIKAAPADTTNKYIVTSNLNPDGKFSGAKYNLVDRVFVGKSKLLK